MRWSVVVLWLTLLAGVVCRSSSGGDEPPSSDRSVNATAATAAVDSEPLARKAPNKCFWRPPEDCPPIADNLTPRCRNVSDGILCCHLTAVFQLKEGLGVAAKSGMPVKFLHIRNATFHELNATELEYLHIENFTMTDGYVGKITGQFSSSITCLNLSGNALEDIYVKALSSLINLSVLDVSHNNLTRLPQLPNRQLKGPNIFWLDISGTNKLQCVNILNLIKNMTNNNTTHMRFSRDNDTYCWTHTSFHWFNSTAKVPLLQVQDVVDLGEKCPSGCNCSVHGGLGLNKNLSVTVDCSGKGMTELPKDLPFNTESLNVSNNKITDLYRLVNDTSYKAIKEFYADNNLISSIAILEASDFLNKFDVLSLRDNKIKTIPTYILKNAFEHQFLRSFIVKLGNNELECNCNTAQVVKVWLVAYKKHIKDLEDILCEDDLGKVVDLDKDKVCIDPRSWTYYIYYIIGAEVALLLLLIVKVSYDYWVFKTAGYLPWPASKMPKLPCDWFFES